MTDFCETKIDLKTWAESIVCLAREGMPAPDKVVQAVEDELRTIARKYKQLGFEDGDKNGWWKEIDNDI